MPQTSTKDKCVERVEAASRGFSGRATAKGSTLKTSDFKPGVAQIYSKRSK